MSKIILTKEQFIEAVTNNWNSIKDKHKIIDFAEFISNENLTTLSLGTLKGMTKAKLREAAINGVQNPLKETSPRVVKSGAEGIASDIVNLLDELKQELQSKPINKLIKNRAIKALENLINKFEDNEKLENLGFIGNCLVIALTFLDVFIDIKTIPSKIKEFKAKRLAENKANEKTNKSQPNG